VGESGAGRTGPGGTSRGLDGITRPGVWWVSSVLTAEAASGRAGAVRGEPDLPAAGALPGLTCLRFGHAAALVGISPVAVPDPGLAAGDISNAAGKALGAPLAGIPGTDPRIYLDI
jgi:hypothetical protein